jgi:hypothetical protein
MYKYGSALDVQKFLGKIPLGFPWSKYPNEKHLPSHNFTGPNTNLEKRLDENDNPLPDSKPFNRVDSAAYKHDLFYRDNTDLNARHNADREMIEELNNIQDPTFREKVERFFVTKALQTKLKLGAGVTEKEANELHKQLKKPRHLLKVKIFHKDNIWSSDLIEVPNDNGYKFILTVIYLYTKYAFAIPLKNKTVLNVKTTLEQIYKLSNRTPKKLWTDSGKEFLNKDVKSLGMEIYTIQNEGKACVIERFNRT